MPHVLCDENIVPAPTLICAAPTPTVLATPATVVEYIAPVPADSYTVPAHPMVAAPPPVVKYTAPAPAVGYAAPVAVQYAMPVQYVAPTLTVTGINLKKVDIPDALWHPSGQFATLTLDMVTWSPALLTPRSELIR